MKKIISFLLCLSIAFTLSACNKRPGAEILPKDYKTRNRAISDYYFDTFSQISTYKDKDDDTIEKYVKIADEVLGYYHKLFDIYYEHSGVNNIKTINDNAGKSPVAVDKEMLDFLEYCKELYA